MGLTPHAAIISRQINPCDAIQNLFLNRNVNIRREKEIRGVPVGGNEWRIFCSRRIDPSGNGRRGLVVAAMQDWGVLIGCWRNFDCLGWDQPISVNLIINNRVDRLLLRRPVKSWCATTGHDKTYRDGEGCPITWLSTSYRSLCQGNNQASTWLLKRIAAPRPTRSWAQTSKRIR